MNAQSERNLKTIHYSEKRAERVRARLQDYMARTGMIVADFAHRINYGRSSLGLFLTGKYHEVSGTHDLICDAIERYIDAHPVELPTETAGELYDTDNSRMIRGIINDLLSDPNGCLLYGAPGTQKTFTLKHAVAQLNREELAKNGHGRRAFYVRARATQKDKPEMTPKQLMQEIAIACGSSAQGDIPRIARNLAWDFRGRRVVIIIDEAQRLTLACLETVRDLLDEPPHFSLLLASMHELVKMFDRWAPMLGQWHDRVIDKVMLPGLSEEEARAIATREVPDITEGRLRKVIVKATRCDVFNAKKEYINVRALTGTLRQMQLLRGRTI